MGFAFASGPRWLARHALAKREVDHDALASLIALGYVADGSALVRGVRSLPPAHFMLLREGQPAAPRRYWDLARHFRDKRPVASAAGAADELRALIDDAVRLRMVSDVPLGAFLSGGIDSSTTVAAMGDVGQRKHIKTFCAGFAEPGYSEAEQARQVARHLGVDHHDCAVTASPSVLIPAIESAAREPFADTSAIPMYFVAQLARQHVTVSLSGDGADEHFAGYETYLADRAHGFLAPLPHWARRGLYALTRVGLPVSHGKVSADFKARQFTAGLLCDSARAHYTWRLLVDRDERATLLQPDWRHTIANADPFAAFSSHFREVEGCDPVDQAMYVDLKTWLPNDILVKVDRMTMQHSLEARAPFLDHRVVEFAAALPVALKLRRWTKKYLLKASQRARLPRSVTTQRKLGFNAPVSHWLLGPLRDFARDVIADRRMDLWFVRAAVEQLWREHEERRRDNGMRLMNLLCFAIWLRST